VSVRLKVTDGAGRPRAAEVCLSAVDESIYSFGEDRAGLLPGFFSDPHPRQHFARKSWRSSLGGATAREVLEEMRDLAKASESMSKMAQEGKSHEAKGVLPQLTRPLPVALLGGLLPATSIPLDRLRSDFRETATWQPQLRAGPDGLVSTSFRLPDSLTQYRLTAVALTKDTQVGVGTARVRASLPLAVQVFLPRFAVEGDRLQAVGLVHNGGGRDRTCQLSWDVEGAKAEGPANLEVSVPAGKSAKVTLWLSFNRVGPVSVSLRCREGEDADQEKRTLEVQPLGRERTVTFSGQLEKRAEVRLPAGFSAREVRVVLARSEAAQALDALGGLLDYPHGCVEQTMSRFLPAVVARQATLQTPLDLPEEVRRKLPDILERGLARLYHFQHPDGGWGWWEHDKTDPRMSIYVVYGLARCEAAGTPVDKPVLESGCRYLRNELAAGRLPELLEGQAWLALGLAGQADSGALGRRAQDALGRELSPEFRCHLALACRAAGSSELAERLHASLRAWAPESTEGLALKLDAQLAFGAPLRACRESASHLLKRRNGLRWESTLATSRAIDGLARLLAYESARAPLKGVRITARGKNLLEVKDAKELGRLVQRYRLRGSDVGEGVVLEIQAESENALPYVLEATGVQRLDRFEAVGKEVKVRRRLETLDGKPVAGPLKVGDVVAVRLEVELDAAQGYVLLEDRRPAHCEFADERVTGPARGSLSHFEFRDDRVCLYSGSLGAGRHEFVYYLRAETAGRAHLLPGYAYPMYADHLRGETEGEVVEVRKSP
jgi:uncharacterized protein YfaS (alpha-2-macroglobulin family)